MGIQMSKASEQAATTHRSHGSQDDMMSKTTEATDDSSAPNSPLDSAYANKMNLHQRRKTSSFVDSMTKASRSFRGLPQSHDTWRSPERASRSIHLKQKEIESPRPSNVASRTAGSMPVKCPNKGFDSTTSREEDAEYLTKMYDSRTWEMYRRITESRKNQPVTYAHSALDKSLSRDTTAWDIPQDNMQCSPRSGHEMIFSFDFD